MGQVEEPQGPRLAEPLVQAARRSSICGVKGLSLLSLLIGLAFAAFVTSLSGAVPKVPVTMAGLPTTNLRTHVQPLKASHFTLPSPGLQFAQPQAAAAQLNRQPLKILQSSLHPRASLITKQATDGAVEEPAPIADAVDPNEEFYGVVNHWNVNKGYGFLKLEDGNNIFCHINYVKGGKKGAWHPSVLDVVKFNKIWEPRKDVYIANNVELVKAGDHRGHNGQVDDEMLAGPMGELHGTVTHWNLQKGFGFIKPEEDDGFGTSDIFCHFSSLVGCSRLVPEDRVSYNRGFNEKSKVFEAKDVRFERQEWNNR